MDFQGFLMDFMRILVNGQWWPVMLPWGGEAGGQGRVAARGGEGARRPPGFPFVWVALELLWFPMLS